jgi:molybdopterin-containing oxidoreductase family membrane subunit
MRRYEILSRRTVFLSLTSIIFGMSCIVLHLGRPERLPIYNALSPNFRSAISWMGALYSIYLAVVAVELWLLLRPELMVRAKRIRPEAGRRLLMLLTLAKLEGGRLGKLLRDWRVGRLVGILAFISGISALTMLGSVFAHTESRPLWYGAYYPIYFLVSALFSGCALLLTAMIMSYRFTGHIIPPKVRSMIFEMAQLLAVLLVAGLGLTAYRLSAALYLPPMQEPVLLLLRGEFSPVFWIFEIGLMTLMPVFTLFWASRKKSLPGVLSGSLAVLTGAFVMRYIFIVSGQTYPVLATNPVSHIPTVFEIMLVCGALGAFCMIYTLGERFLPLMEPDPHQA